MKDGRSDWAFRLFLFFRRRLSTTLFLVYNWLQRKVDPDFLVHPRDAHFLWRLDITTGNANLANLACAFAAFSLGRVIGQGAWRVMKVARAQGG